MANPPLHASNWMFDNVNLLKDLPINALLWLPGSRDSGMINKPTSKTDNLSEAMVTTQTLDIYQQLLSGVRWLEVRAVVRDHEWYCGYHRFRMFENRPVAIGATGISVQTFIEQVNKFTADHKELVVIKVTQYPGHGDDQFGLGPGVIGQAIPRADGSQLPATPKLKSIGDTLREGLHDVYTSPHDEDVTRKTVNELIMRTGSPKSCVVVSVEKQGGIAFDHPRTGPAHHHNYYDEFLRTKLGVVLSQTDFGITELWNKVKDALPYLFKKGDHALANLINLAHEFYNQEIQFAPQRIFTVNKAGVFDLDDISDDAALTVCLAAIHMERCRRNPQEYPTRLIVVYGGKRVENPDAINRIRDAINNRTILEVNNHTMGWTNEQDPWPGKRKHVVVYQYTESKSPDNPDRFFMGRLGREKHHIDFATDINSIWFENHHLTYTNFSWAYYALFRAITLQHVFTSNLETLNIRNDDPRPSESKSFTITYSRFDHEWVHEAERQRSLPTNTDRLRFNMESNWSCINSGAIIKERRLPEHAKIDFGVDILYIDFGGRFVKVGTPYREMFGKLDDTDGGNHPKVLLDWVKTGDPAMHEQKVASMKFKCGKHDSWRVDQCKEHDIWDIQDAYRYKRMKDEGENFPEYHG
jgi:hypothetical protein